MHHVQKLTCEDTKKCWPKYQEFQQQEKHTTKQKNQNIQDKKQLQKFKRVEYQVMNDTECKANICINTDPQNDPEDVEVSLFGLKKK